MFFQHQHQCSFVGTSLSCSEIKPKPGHLCNTLGSVCWISPAHSHVSQWWASCGSTGLSLALLWSGLGVYEKVEARHLPAETSMNSSESLGIGQLFAQGEKKMNRKKSWGRLRRETIQGEWAHAHPSNELPCENGDSQFFRELLGFLREREPPSVYIPVRVSHTSSGWDCIGKKRHLYLIFGALPGGSVVINSGA